MKDRKHRNCRGPDARAKLPGPDLGDPLTDRERQVMTLLCEGRTIKEVAGILHVTRNTADKHTGAIHVKWGVRSQIFMLRHALLTGDYVLRRVEGDNA